MGELSVGVKMHNQFAIVSIYNNSILQSKCALKKLTHLQAVLISLYIVLFAIGVTFYISSINSFFLSILDTLTLCSLCLVVLEICSEIFTAVVFLPFSFKLK